MRTSSRAIWVFSLALFAAAARADVPAGYLDRTPAALARDAFDSDYGRLLVVELGRILRESADAECLRARAIEPAMLEARGRDLLVRNGTRLLETDMRLVDAAKFEALVASRAGKSAKAELAALREDPDVRKYLELLEPALRATLADFIAEAVDRYGLMAGIKLKSQVSRVSTGKQALFDADPTEQATQEAERFLESRKSARLARWVEIQTAVLEAQQQAADRETFLRMGPMDMTPGADADFADLCVFAGRR